MIHCVLHDSIDSVAVVVTEDIDSSQILTALNLGEDRTIGVPCKVDIPIGQKVAMRHMSLADTVIEYSVDIDKVVGSIGPHRLTYQKLNGARATVLSRQTFLEGR
ncbi:MAG: flagellar biosynthesis protein FlgA [Candidatus Micrarchaeaceae archaeon]